MSVVTDIIERDRKALVVLRALETMKEDYVLKGDRENARIFNDVITYTPWYRLAQLFDAIKEA